MPETSEPSARRLEIKKYPNRRYYDATHSRHLTLEEIRSMIRDGYDIRVIDAKTSADITAQVLTQIILELETRKIESFPVPLLVRLIRVNDQLTRDFIDKYFNQAFKSFLDYQQQLELEMRKAHGLTANLPTLTDWAKIVFGPFASAFQGAAPAPGPPPAGSAAGPGPERELRELVRDLQQQVAELKARRPAGRKKRKASRR
jgi:polyhydroxyalkanoate synthesis repressor PhaR